MYVNVPVYNTLGVVYTDSLLSINTICMFSFVLAGDDMVIYQNGQSCTDTTKGSRLFTDGNFVSTLHVYVAAIRRC